MAKIKDKLAVAADRVWETWRKYGPVDDGRPEGDDFDEALLELRAVSRKHKHQTSSERAALVSIVNAANEFTEPMHYKIREAIEAARKVLDSTNMHVAE